MRTLSIFVEKNVSDSKLKYIRPIVVSKDFVRIQKAFGADHRQYMGTKTYSDVLAEVQNRRTITKDGDDCNLM